MRKRKTIGLLHKGKKIDVKLRSLKTKISPIRNMKGCSRASSSDEISNEEAVERGEMLEEDYLGLEEMMALKEKRTFAKLERKSH